MIERVTRAGVKSPASSAPKQADNRFAQINLTAARSLSDLKLIKSKQHRDKVFKTSWDNTHPEILDFYRAFQKELASRNMPFYAFFFYRTHEQQDELYRKGRTKARGGSSPHNYGLAVDIVHSTRFWDLTEDEWGLIGTIGKEVARKRNIAIEWGGDWNFYDPAHWQLKNWRDRRDQFDNWRNDPPPTIVSS